MYCSEFGNEIIFLMSYSLLFKWLVFKANGICSLHVWIGCPKHVYSIQFGTKVKKFFLNHTVYVHVHVQYMYRLVFKAGIDTMPTKR